MNNFSRKNEKTKINYGVQIVQKYGLNAVDTNGPTMVGPEK